MIQKNKNIFLIVDEMKAGDYLVIKLDKPLPFEPIHKCIIRGKEYALTPVMGDKKSVFDMDTIAIKEKKSLIGAEVTFL